MPHFMHDQVSEELLMHFFDISFRCAGRFQHGQTGKELSFQFGSYFAGSFTLRVHTWYMHIFQGTVTAGSIAIEQFIKDGCGASREPFYGDVGADDLTGT